MRKQAFLLLVVCVMITALGGTAWAIDPRDAMGAPAGTDVFTFFSLRYQGSNYYVNGTKTSNNAPFTVNAEAFRYGHFWGVGKDMTFLVATLFPVYADFTVNGAPVGNQQRSASGLGDATATFTFWPLADWKTKHWFAGSLWVTAPTGDYDNNRAVNVGRNVWTIRPELAWIKGWGPFYLQLVADLYFDTDNNNYGPAGKTLQRDALFTGEVHGSYNFTPDFWVALSWYYAKGYQSKIKETGVDNSDDQKDQTIGLSLYYRLTKNLGIMVSSNYKAVTNNGFDAAEVFRLKLTYAF